MAIFTNSRKKKSEYLNQLSWTQPVNLYDRVWAHSYSSLWHSDKEILNKEYIFPSNDEKYKDVNIFIGSLLNKKVNKRECNVSALKKSEFFKGFDFDQCKDFKMVPPYIPQGVDLSKYLITKNPYENYVSQDIFKTKNKQYEHSFPVGCNRSWADEF